jgi:hypothetical protein
MKTLTHHSPLGELEIPTVLGPVPPGVPFAVDDDIADSLLEQTDIYQLATAPKPGSPAALRLAAAAHGIDTTGMTKADITAALAAAATQEAQA